jgi:hypothetical protein
MCSVSKIKCQECRLTVIGVGTIETFAHIPSAFVNIHHSSRAHHPLYPTFAFRLFNFCVCQMPTVSVLARVLTSAASHAHQACLCQIAKPGQTLIIPIVRVTAKIMETLE